MKKKEENWFKLDNAGKVYTVLHRPHCDCVWRIAVNMKETVDPFVLQNAVNDLKERYPIFFSRLRRGFFWCYLEKNPNTFEVVPESDIMGNFINPRLNNEYLFRVAFYKNRISLECCHGISDGFGGIELMKSIIYRYLELQNKKVDAEGKIKLKDEKVDEKELEESFLKYYKKQKTQRDYHPKAFHIKGKKINKNIAPAVIYGKCNSDALKKLAKEKGVSITQYISALYTYSVIKTQDKKIKKLPVTVCIPINLRKMFPSQTLRNFSLVFYTTIYNKKDITFEEILQITKSQFIEGATEKVQQNFINANIKIQKNPFVRFCPTGLKNQLIKIGFHIIGSKISTRCISNLGVVDIPESLKPYIVDFECSNTNNVALMTGNGRTTISFSREIEESEIEQFFFSFLSKQGIKLEIQSNLRELDFKEEK